MSETKLIYSAIPAIIAEVGPVGKTTKNQQQGYMYRSADDICDALHDALGKHGVFTTCKIESIERSERPSKSGGSLQIVNVKAVYTFHAKDGSCVPTEAVGDGMDSGDKAANKAMTAAYKYALIQTFAMMGHEDSEVDSPEVAPVKGTATARSDAKKKTSELAKEHDALTGADFAWVEDFKKQLSEANTREVLEAIAAFGKDKPDQIRKIAGPLWVTRAKTFGWQYPSWKLPDGVESGWVGA